MVNNQQDEFFAKSTMLKMEIFFSSNFGVLGVIFTHMFSQISYVLFSVSQLPSVSVLYSFLYSEVIIKTLPGSHGNEFC